MNRGRIFLLGFIGLSVGAFFYFDGGSYLSLDYLKSRQADIAAYYAHDPLRAAGIFFFVYVLVTGLSLPGAAIMTLVGGAIFGLLWGTVIVSFASSLGATLAFLVSRFVLRNTVRRRFGDRLGAVNSGITKDGAFYLFGLRLVPLFPFWLINLVMGLTPLRVGTFYLVSQLGMLPGTVVYVNAGTHLGKLDSLAGILSPGLILSFVALAFFPLIARRLLAWIRARRALARFDKPKHFDRNLVVIGAGSAGLVSAYIAAAVKAKVTLIEKDRMGGDCLNTGCVPSKALIRSAKFVSHVHRAAEFGMKQASVEFEFADVMARVRRVIRQIQPHDSVERYTALGVECLSGEARVTSPWTVDVNGQTLTTRNIVIATGARPRLPDIPGLEQVGYYTSDTVWNLKEQPMRLLVLGGGPIGCELAQCFQRLGSQVTLVQRGPRLLPREDADIAERLANRFRVEGIEMLTSHTARRARLEGGQRTLICDRVGESVEIPFDVLLIALGREAQVAGFGLEELGVIAAPDGTLETDGTLRTRVPTIHACGDVAGPYQFTHTAAHQAWYATVNSLFGTLKRFRVDYSVIPWCTFTDPEVARVGLNEQEAKEKNIAYELTSYAIDELDRAITDEEAHGVVKVLTVPGKDRVLGATIVGEHAGDLIAEFVAAMRHRLGLNKILGTIHVYPTLAEANKFAAGEWKKMHKPERVLSWVERYHRWRRL